LNSKQTIRLLIIGALIFSCSTKKDAFINKKYHALTAKYNILYNGKNAFNQGIEELNSNYVDDFSEVLPIEPLKVEVLATPNQEASAAATPQAFEIAEEKAVKAIQKHSMVIKQREKNPQIDDAYLLLGKARYYSKRFVPALEAFNFVLNTYPNADLINETKIWQAKTQIRLANEEQAIKNLERLIQGENLNVETAENAYTALAMAYKGLGNVNKTKHHLKQATKSDENNVQTARNLFVLGQLYQKENALDSANIAFSKVIDFKKIPHKYIIHSKIEKAKNTLQTNADFELDKALKKLLKDRDNRPYFDLIYYQLGNMEMVKDTEKATDYYQKSLAHNVENQLQKELSYQALGNIYFNNANFITAGKYYDSILQITTQNNSKRVRQLTRKRESLEDVILYENIRKHTDSVLRLVEMSAEEQVSFFENYTKKLKLADEELELKLADKAQKNSGFFGFIKNKKQDINAGQWYFYNIQTVGFGAQEFRAIWGDRKLEDNWRLSDKSPLTRNIENYNMVPTPIANAEKYNVETYIKLIPTNSEVIDSLVNSRNNAYYKLGIVYKDQFNEPKLAIQRLEKLLTYNPPTNLGIPAKYHLHKAYLTVNSTKANEYKNEIITNYPNSKYAKILANPEAFATDNSANEAENEYIGMFFEYKEGKYQSVIDKTSNAIVTYEGKPIAAKFALLNAYAIGKLNGTEAFNEALTKVSINYPNTEEAKKALEVIETLKKL